MWWVNCHVGAIPYYALFAVLLTTIDVETVRAAIVGKTLPRSTKPVTGISLGAAFELACARLFWERSAHPAAQLVRSWSACSASAEEILDCLDRTSRSNPVAFERAPRFENAPQPPRFEYPLRFEVARIASRNDVTGQRAVEFQRRFQGSLVNNGFPKTLALGITMVFCEMADNVVQHSTDTEGVPALGIWGYHVEHRWMSFAVADTGRGILRSLRSAPKYAALRSAGEALNAAFRQHASRRVATDPDHKGAFSHLEKRLAELNGVLRFRSDDARVTLDGRAGRYETTFASSAQLPGFQMVATCALDPQSGERSLA